MIKGVAKLYITMLCQKHNIKEPEVNISGRLKQYYIFDKETLTLSKKLLEQDSEFIKIIIQKALVDIVYRLNTYSGKKLARELDIKIKIGKIWK